MNRMITILLLALTGCADLDPPTLIKRDRILGAKVTVDADPERAWPAPGEQATVTWLTASPGATPTFSWTLAACPAATSSGVPICAGPPFASTQSTGPVPMLQLAIPSDLEAPSIVVMGAICASGAPILDEASSVAECDDGSQADVVSQHVFLATEGATNHNPDLGSAPITLAGMDWEPSTDTGCDGALAVVEAGSERMLVGATFDASDRETFPVTDESRPTREELQLAAFATAGEIIQQHIYVDWDDERTASPIALEWVPPSADEVPAGGLRVKFFFVVRDLRGGVDATSRELCVQ